MKKILVIISNNIESGGVESYLLNAYKHINLAGINIELLVPGRIVYEKKAEEFKNVGCKIITLGLKEGILRNVKLFIKLRKIMKQSRYDSVHVNTGNLTIEALSLFCASKSNIKQRIAHSHGTIYFANVFKRFVRYFLRKIINKNATVRLACSISAAESLYGKKSIENVIIAKNGIDAKKYVFNQDIRNFVREKFDWKDKYLIGSVGRLAPEKNYSFVIKVFKKIHEIMPDSRLVLIGDGEERDLLINLSKEFNIYNFIDFLGVRNDVPDLLQAIDVFVLASKREALGIVNIEAQATGLPCVISDVIPNDVDISGNVKFLPIKEDIKIWANEILKFKNYVTRKDNTKLVINNGYDFSTSYKVLNDIYYNDEVLNESH